MLDVLPFLTWIAGIASAILLVVLWILGDLSTGSRLALTLWFLAAGWLQFYGHSPMASAVGLALQTLLAVGLSVRVRYGR